MSSRDLEFEKEVSDGIDKMENSEALSELSAQWFLESLKYKYSYHFKSMGLPIIQYPTDIVALQEIIWDVKPDLIIETGVARGGSVVHNAAMLALLDYTDELNSCSKNNRNTRHVVSIDIDIRAHNREALENHPLKSYFTLIQGSSIEESVIKKVHTIANKYQNIMVLLDSNHTKEHVEKELEAYADLVTVGNYCIVYDTVIEKLPDIFPDRPWSVGNSPMNAVNEFQMKFPKKFVVDTQLDAKLQFSVAPGGYLKRVGE